MIPSMNPLWMRGSGRPEKGLSPGSSCPRTRYFAPVLNIRDLNVRER